MRHFDFLVEIGTEELPPKSLLKLSEAFTGGILQRIEKAGLSFTKYKSFAAPRRLALLIEGLDEEQPDQSSEKRGPALAAAFDPAGNPTKACEGFARSCGTTPDKLEKLETEKGTWLVFKQTVKGEKTRHLLTGFVTESLTDLPIPKRMRWGAGRDEFVRPVHWIVMLANGDVVPGSILGKHADRFTQGHRFHHPSKISLSFARDYETVLKETGKVIADFSQRRSSIEEQVNALARKKGAEAVIDPALLDEVSALNEWPVALLGKFEERFLKVPAEALISTMKENQKYFHILDSAGLMLPNFITVSNIESRDPQKVIEGNERVIRPRLSDAAFFFELDKRSPLADRLEALKPIVFQKELGTLYDRVQRISELSGKIANTVGADRDQAERAGLLSKADLVTSMVLEFPELQGIMGHYYAKESGESAAVAEAIEQHYQPRFSGDSLPSGKIGTVVSLAEKLDTLTGIFGINQPPTGTKDPFALRRAALGALRIIVEKELNLDLRDLVSWSMEAYQVKLPAKNLVETVTDYLLERFRAWYDEAGVSAEVFLSVAARRPTKPLDFNLRVNAVNAFMEESAAATLIAANKRVSNILDKEDVSTLKPVNSGLLTLSEEKALYTEIQRLEKAVEPLLTRFDYTGALNLLAALKEPVDAFFDKVMVMADDPAIKANRLAILSALRSLFLQIADISLLQGLIRKD